MDKVHIIDLKSMKPASNRKDRPVAPENSKQSMNFSQDGELILKAPGDLECMQTAESYTFPLRIDLTAKTDSTNIRLYYKSGVLIFNWEIRKDELKVHDFLTGRGYGVRGVGQIPDNEYTNISWIIDRNEMLVLVNDELIHFAEDDLPYFTSREVTQNKKISEHVRVAAAWGSTVTIKSLTVTELENI